MLALYLPFQGCKSYGGNDDKGELTGRAPEASWETNVIPYGMVEVPSGTFHLGQADEDPTYSKINMNRQVTISSFYMDDTEITNNEYRQFWLAVGELNQQRGANPPTGDDKYVIGVDGNKELAIPDFMSQEELRPDSTVWTKDFANHMGDPMQEHYFSHPSFGSYPVVGVSRNAALEFCKWRTYHMNSYRMQNGDAEMPKFALPSEAQWEYAARGGLRGAKYPWGMPYIRNGKGCALANFKPGRGNYYDDGYSYTSPVGEFYPNGYGLYDMAGNVSEWCLDAFNPAAYPIVWDLNPIFLNPSERKKVVRGGSWKDISFYTETGTRTYEFEDRARAYIGFRCVMVSLGGYSGLN
ncbi:hypothetical protein GCM10023331_16110 [Algivirga pacifica]|uniref:Sulfatase-modifying factor enzyme-like domain-containing protein n=2 Tax=Algivirga pacifica TaxID=1162670 RepID=A0ABP9DAD3_9BACT